MFGLVADETLYLKADDANRSDFEERGLQRFVYYKQLINPCICPMTRHRKRP